jgi:hypothetical protein
MTIKIGSQSLLFFPELLQWSRPSHFSSHEIIATQNKIQNQEEPTSYTSKAEDADTFFRTFIPVYIRHWFVAGQNCTR